MASFMYLVFSVGCWLGDLSFPVASLPLVGMAGLFHMRNKVFQEDKNRNCKNLLRSNLSNNPVCCGVNLSPLNLYVETPTPSINVFGDRVFMR